ncbi:hypothetical protein B0H16DRAFT_684679 [Mycena metata]|uniref:Uncharacterized protein n=1 Tax=Mycena metata TaxID=1033252 RepID=A0AAD7M980_9AGAR|nr:hypothetical protein B0H16DRAFT_684679 [Mycena metata]
MAIELGEGQQSWTARFLATICDVFRALTYLFYTLWTRAIRAHTPDVAERYWKTLLLLDCEKGHGDVYQVCPRTSAGRAALLRDAADAAFEAEVLALLAPVKQRLAKLTCNGNGGPQGTDRTPMPPSRAGTRTQAPASLRPTHNRETAPDIVLVGAAGCGHLDARARIPPSHRDRARVRAAEIPGAVHR